MTDANTLKTLQGSLQIELATNYLNNTIEPLLVKAASDPFTNSIRVSVSAKLTQLSNEISNQLEKLGYKVDWDFTDDEDESGFLIIKW